jgi:hypothetical protein
VHELQLLATVPCQTIDLDHSKLEFRVLRGFRGDGLNGGWVYDVPCRSRARGIQG